MAARSGGQVRHELPRQTLPDQTINISDALILAPVQDSAVHTLRERALRNQIPLLAESSSFPGAIYLGPNNYEAAFRLGRWTGEYVQENMGRRCSACWTSLRWCWTTPARAAPGLPKGCAIFWVTRAVHHYD